MFRLNPGLALPKTRNPNQNNNSGVRPNSSFSPSKYVRNIQIRVFSLNLTPQKNRIRVRPIGWSGVLYLEQGLPLQQSCSQQGGHIRKLNSSFFSAESYLRVECTPEKKRNRIYIIYIYIHICIHNSCKLICVII